MDRVPVAKLAGVSHRYGAVTALEAVDLALPAGCMVGLIGPDGVGKSSLLALVSGARQFQTGKIEVLGGDIEINAQGLEAWLERLRKASA